MMDDEELEMLLGEIPYVTGNPTMKHRMMMMYGMHNDGGYSQNMFSNGHTSSSHNPYLISRNPSSESSSRKEVDQNLIDVISRMLINHDENQGLHSHNQTPFRDSDYLSRIPINPDYVSSQPSFGLKNHSWGARAQAQAHDPHWFHMPAGSSRITRVGPELGLEGEDSLIIQGEDVSRVRKKLTRHCENGQTNGQRIFAMAKDQHGCRLLQKIFDEGNPQHVQTVFNEIIGHVVELMINPFGNYFIQKLLEVCNEEQRTRVLIAITREPRGLVQISMNTHGTRVVQKVIETLKTRQQIKLVISAIERGFLDLIKDLNGNHVIQRCLQCFSNEDNKVWTC
ncbi:pumilio homolog 9-like [Bidens hawaiensis]|uniref:pumilio homolog 9-like n=1 Tax=Bidens hawaiensis TaxID=980011 RepID=UPI004049FA34